MMKPIETDIWRPKENDPRYSEYVGQRSAEEVFRELEQRLNSMGMLPDEYFLLDRDWQDGRLIPKDADIFVTTDYGESEGICLDGYLKWYEDGKPVIKSFFTGKTLGETGADMDRMFLISSAITKAFHGYGRQPDNGMVLYLSAEEKKEIIDALVEKLERTLDQADRVEKLLRHATGSITAYMDTVGERPLHMSDHDRASLAIRDGELAAFKELLPKCVKTLDTLLVEAASRVGDVGRKMTIEAVAATSQISEPAYMQASKNAVEIGDMERVKFLMEQAQHIVEGIDASYYGEVIKAAHLHNRRMENELIQWSPAEWIAAATPDLMVGAVQDRDYHRIGTLLEKGIDTTVNAADIFHYAYAGYDQHMAKFLVEQGMKVSPGDCRALDVCVSKGDTATSLLLLDHGMDFEKYAEWADEHYGGGITSSVVDAMREHWQEIRQQQIAAPEEAPAQGQVFGGLSQ